MALIGYARVSTSTQSLDAQTDALDEAGCTKIFSEACSGAAEERPQFDAMLQYVRDGDVIVVTRLDRFGRNLGQVVQTIADLHERDIAVRGLQDGVDTSTSAGRMVAGIFAVLAQYERELIAERTSARLEAIRSRGGRVGRNPVVTEDKYEAVRLLHREGKSVRTIAAAVGVSKSVVGRLVRELGDAKTTTEAA